MNNSQDERAPQAEEEVTVTIAPLNDDDPRAFTFEKTKKVGEAAEEAAEAFGYDADGFTLQLGDKVLDSDKPLVAAGIVGDELYELANTGGGVV